MFRHLRILMALACLSASGAAAPQAPSPPGAAQGFRPDILFAGRTQGTGTIRIATSSRPRILSVEGIGTVAPDGGLSLAQAVTQDGKTSHRNFRIRRAADGSWTGTLTEAVGPVRGVVDGRRMTLGYRMRRGMRMHQLLDLAPDGRTVRNRARVTLLGIEVARVDETIVKLD